MLTSSDEMGACACKVSIARATWQLNVVAARVHRQQVAVNVRLLNLNCVRYTIWAIRRIELGLFALVNIRTDQTA